MDRRALAWALCLLEAHPEAKLTAIHARVCEKCVQENWGSPGYRQLCRALSNLPQDMRVMLREGERRAFEQASLVARIEQGYPNELWQMDFTEIPFWIRDMATGELYKPFMTAAIDSFSRACVGVRIHRQAPDTNESLICLHTCMSAKGDERLPFFGVPKRLRSDHGSVYESTDFLDTLLRLDVIWDPAPKSCPSANGKIERWFQTFTNGLITTLQGHANQFRGLSRAKESALPSTHFEKLVWDYIRRYNHTRHSSIGCTPFERWVNHLGDAKGLNIDASEISLAIRVRKEMTVERDGIALWGRHFSSEALVGLVGEKVIVRLPVEGTAENIECYTLSGTLIGLLTPVEGDSDLAARINSERLSRTHAIHDLARVLREQSPGLRPASRIPTAPADDNGPSVSEGRIQPSEPLPQEES
ncbi:MAG: DDE-type integrase/transposase/recombinase [Candidatus Methylacidiphilales bacterium]|nr:DDE-type integrase/transposase/recombinase [Candidatus Methylacidiphilales bacterium]